jgi:hypothetical protein
MKKFILPLLGLLILSSCSNDDDAQQVIEPLVITKADYQTHYSPGGETFTVFATSPSNVSIPSPGEDQTWDFSELDELGSGVVGGSDFLIPSNPAFPTATYAEGITGFYFISGVASNDYTGFRFHELNDDGLFGLGLVQNQTAVLNVEAIGAVINYEAQTRPYTGTPKSPRVLFPAEFGDDPITTNGVEDTSSFTVNAPAFGLNNTPGQTVNTYDITQEVIASGIANFKGIGEKRVLVTKSETTMTINYFLGGAPAPADLLSVLGVSNGSTRTETTYRFIAEGLGSAGFIDVDESGNITSARFWKQ